MALTENKINLDDNGVWSISVKAKKPFEVQGEPWMDETSSFYIADVELVDSREEPELDDDVLEEAQAMSDAIPELVEEWLKLVLSTEASDVEGMSKIMKVCKKDFSTFRLSLWRHSRFFCQKINSHLTLTHCRILVPCQKRLVAEQCG